MTLYSVPRIIEWLSHRYISFYPPAEETFLPAEYRFLDHLVSSLAFSKEALPLAWDASE
jgi:hypothetical protein